MEKRFYFDHNATTPVAPEVFEEMRPYFGDWYGNPSSVHYPGKRALRAVTTARERVAKLIHADPREIIFTSCGSESNNSVFRSLFREFSKQLRVITSSVEHSSVRKMAEELAVLGADLVVIPVDRDGALNLDQLSRALETKTQLVSVMWANNETGVVFPVEKIAALVKSKGARLHVDAVQAAGKLPVDVRQMPVDYLSLSAHKFCGPKGVGALYVRAKTPFHSYLVGGTQERGSRAGTENVPGIAGMGKAAELASEHLNAHAAAIGRLRDRMEQELLQKIPGSFVNGRTLNRVFNTTSLTIPGASGESLIARLDEVGICVSSGSACLSGATEPSHVLRAMGLSEALAKSSVRFSLGYGTSESDVARLIDSVTTIVPAIRKPSENKEKLHANGN